MLFEPFGCAHPGPSQAMQLDLSFSVEVFVVLGVYSTLVKYKKRKTSADELEWGDEIKEYKNVLGA